jgi:hypothetical protein
MRRQTFIALLMLWIAGLVNTVPALAADPPLIPMSPELRKFMSDPEEEKIVKAQALHDWSNTVLGCTTPPTLDVANVVVGKAPAFDKAGKPVSGTWRVITRLSGCGQAKNFSLLYAFAANGQMVRLGMLPGSSAADPILQRDAFMYANLAMGKLTPPGCKEFKYLDTAFEAFGAAGPNVPAGREARSWTEKWRVRACGVEGIVKLYFTPDATGTAISAKLNETVSAPAK